MKPFGMSYARIETRSTYHQNLGPRAANFTARAIFDSPFVQKKFAFAAFLTMSPNGLLGVDADRDLYALNERVTRSGCALYGKMMTLFGEIDECIVAPRLPLPRRLRVLGRRDLRQLRGREHRPVRPRAPLPAYTWYTESFYGKSGRPLLPEIPPMNPAIKMCVHNYAWTGYPSAFFSEHMPTVIVGDAQAELFDRDPQNLDYTKHATIARSTEAAMAFAKKVTGTEKILVFDGAMGGINLSAPLADLLLAKAPEVSRRVDEVLLPKWLKQRGIAPAAT